MQLCVYFMSVCATHVCARACACVFCFLQPDYEPPRVESVGQFTCYFFSQLLELLIAPQAQQQSPLLWSLRIQLNYTRILRGGRPCPRGHQRNTSQPSKEETDSDNTQAYVWNELGKHEPGECDGFETFKSLLSPLIKHLIGYPVCPNPRTPPQSYPRGFSPARARWGTAGRDRLEGTTATAPRRPAATARPKPAEPPTAGVPAHNCER